MDRRKLLTGLLALGGTVLAGAVAVPALLATMHPSLARRKGAKWREVGELESFEVGKIQAAVVAVGRGDWARSLETKSVYVWRQVAPKATVVFSRNCTDLSCPVNYDPASECFFCPCHGGIFDKEGRPLAGPPPVSLFRYAVRVRAGKLEIDLRSLPPMT